jgi:hypothetical protein
VDVHGLIGVNVDQFFGIEIEEFPAQITRPHEIRSEVR